MKHALTKRQGDVYAFIRTYTKDKAMAPSYSEIARGVGMSSKSEVYDVLKRLERRGYISRLKGQPRSITIITDDPDELHLLHMIRDSASTFVQVQENFRSKFDEDQTSESTLAAGARVSTAFENLRQLVKGEIE
jgi:SOS-response transcriptional repressor LexA